MGRRIRKQEQCHLPRQFQRTNVRIAIDLKEAAYHYRDARYHCDVALHCGSHGLAVCSARALFEAMATRIFAFAIATAFLQGQSLLPSRSKPTAPVIEDY